MALKSACLAGQVSEVTELSRPEQGWPEGATRHLAAGCPSEPRPARAVRLCCVGKEDPNVLCRGANGALLDPIGALEAQDRKSQAPLCTHRHTNTRTSVPSPTGPSKPSVPTWWTRSLRLGEVQSYSTFPLSPALLLLLTFPATTYCRITLLPCRTGGEIDSLFACPGRTVWQSDRVWQKWVPVLATQSGSESPPGPPRRHPPQPFT